MRAADLAARAGGWRRRSRSRCWSAAAMSLVNQTTARAAASSRTLGEAGRHVCVLNVASVIESLTPSNLGNLSKATRCIMNGLIYSDSRLHSNLHHGGGGEVVGVIDRRAGERVRQPKRGRGRERPILERSLYLLCHYRVELVPDAAQKKGYTSLTGCLPIERHKRCGTYAACHTVRKDRLWRGITLFASALTRTRRRIPNTHKDRRFLQWPKIKKLSQKTESESQNGPLRSPL